MSKCQACGSRDRQHIPGEPACIELCEKTRQELEESKAETAAAIHFLETEMGWEYFRADMLYFDDSTQKTASQQNAQKLKNYLTDKGHGVQLLRDLAEAKRQALEADASFYECQAERDQLVTQLAECYRLSGADPDGNEDWRLAPHAVGEVQRLRQEHDELGAEIHAYKETVAALEAGIVPPPELSAIADERDQFKEMLSEAKRREEELQADNLKLVNDLELEGVRLEQLQGTIREMLDESAAVKHGLVDPLTARVKTLEDVLTSVRDLTCGTAAVILIGSPSTLNRAHVSSAVISNAQKAMVLIEQALAAKEQACRHQHFTQGKCDNCGKVFTDNDTHEPCHTAKEPKAATCECGTPIADEDIYYDGDGNYICPTCLEQARMEPQA